MASTAHLVMLWRACGLLLILDQHILRGDVFSYIIRRARMKQLRASVLVRSHPWDRLLSLLENQLLLQLAGRALVSVSVVFKSGHGILR